jgi:putative FmdB family regulatory protein
MPIYEYVCDNGHRFDVIHGIHDSGPSECPVCGSTGVRKAFAAPAIHFKGSGWAKKDRSATSKAGSGSADTKPAETPAAATSDSSGSETASSSTTATKEPASKSTTPANGDPD